MADIAPATVECLAESRRHWLFVNDAVGNGIRVCSGRLLSDPRPAIRRAVCRQLATASDRRTPPLSDQVHNRRSRPNADYRSIFDRISSNLRGSAGLDRPLTGRASHFGHGRFRALHLAVTDPLQSAPEINQFTLKPEKPRTVLADIENISTLRVESPDLKIGDDRLQRNRDMLRYPLEFIEFLHHLPLKFGAQKTPEHWAANLEN